MIIKEYQLEKLISDSALPSNILIYGPNEGLVKEYFEKITRDYLNKDDYEKINLSGKDIDNNPQVLDDTTRTVSMFFKNKLVIADSIKDKHFNIIEKTIKDAPQQVFLIILDGNLNKSSKIRKLFEDNKDCVSLACYEDDSISIIKNIDEFIKKIKLEVEPDIKSYLLQTLSNDRMVSKRELEKIELFYKNSTKVNFAEIKSLLNDSSSQNLNKMNENVMYGNTVKSSKIINKLLSEGSSPISILRSLGNYLKRIQLTKIEMKKGNNFDISIKTLKPPLFWKDKDSFQKHCMKWPLTGVETSLYKILEAEVLCKLNSKLANFNCERSILLIANSGKKYFKN